MPTESIVVVVAVVAAFVFFAGVVTYSDMTWSPRGKGGERR